jgi:hypothetical protein
MAQLTQTGEMKTKTQMTTAVILAPENVLNFE